MRVLSHTSAKRMARCSVVSLMPKSYVITRGASVRNLLAALLFLIASAASAQWPARPVKLVVPSSAGGGTDFYARLLAQALGDAFGQQFVVENLPGGSGNVGAATAARAAPDGYTFLVAPHLRSGRFLALAVTHRTAQLPDVPAIADAGFPGFAMPSNFSVVAPAGTPRPIVERMNA